MLLVIDNYDSFTYNLVQFLGELGAEMQVYRNDKISTAEALELGPGGVLISPGPCTPEKAGISKAMIETFAGKVPVLGVCLGHQSIGEVFGGEVVRADYLMHGKTSMIHHNGRTIFEGIDNPFEATRYHSLIVKKETLPECLELTAWTDDGVVMGIKHKQHPTWGVQFHPESILTAPGKKLLGNFLKQLDN